MTYTASGVNFKGQRRLSGQVLSGFQTPLQGLERGPTGFCKILSDLIQARESLIKKRKGKVSTVERSKPSAQIPGTKMAPEMIQFYGPT
jgi:hypothetical protein